MSENIVQFDDLEAEVDNVDGRLISVRSKKRAKNKSFLANLSMLGDVIQGIINPKTGNVENFGNTTLSTIPTGVPPNGTVAADGTITLVAALRTTYPHAWVYLPAGAVVGGLAGMYYVRMSSTTVGQVFTNYVNATTTEFVPFIPSETPTLAVGSGSAYTQTTGTGLNIFNKTIVGNLLGPRGMLRASPLYTVSNNANNKVGRLWYGTAGSFQSAGISTVNGQAAIVTLRNKGVTNAQMAFNSNNGDIGNPGGVSDITVDSTINQPLLFTGQITNATTDYLFLEGLTLEVFPQS